MTDQEKHTPDSIMIKLKACETEVGMQMEALRLELDEHQSVVNDMKDDWDQFIIDFRELLVIFRSAKGFFHVLGWIGTSVKWLAVFGAAAGAVVIFIKTGHWPGLGD